MMDSRTKECLPVSDPWTGTPISVAPWLRTSGRWPGCPDNRLREAHGAFPLPLNAQGFGFGKPSQTNGAGQVSDHKNTRYHSLINKIQAAVVVHAADTRIMACNAKAQELLGLTSDQMMGKTAADPEWKFFDKDGRPLSFENYPVNQVIHNRKPLRDQTVGIYRPDIDETVWVLVNADPEFDDRDRLSEVIVTFIDITETRRATETLRQREAQMKMILDHIPDLILYLDKDMKIKWANRTALALNPDCVGRFCYQVFPHRTGTCADCPVVKSIDDGEIQSGFVYQPESSPASGKAWWNISVVPVKNLLNEVTGAIEFGRSISGNEVLEKRRRFRPRTELMHTLIGGIAHDFNNILHSIIGNADLALDDISEGDRAYENLEDIMSAGLRATNIVKQLLHHNRMIDLDLMRVGAGTVIEDALAPIITSMPANIELNQRLPETEMTLLADPEQLSHAIRHIVTNAVQAMETAGGRIMIDVEKQYMAAGTITSYPEMAAGQYILISIRDSGPGIAYQHIDRVFDPYFTTREPGRGSGLGLTVSMGIVKNHGGVITVDSRPGKGASFTLVLPMDAPGLDENAD